MHYLRRPTWRLPETAATPEHVFWNRRRFLKLGAGAMAVGAVSACGDAGDAGAALADSGGAKEGDLAYYGLDTELFSPRPAMNPLYADAGRPITDEITNGSYNNFYEFASHKRIFDKAQALPTDAWTVVVDGLVENEKTYDVDDLLARMPMEERVVRHRCVEAWSMVAPWIGFPLSALLNEARPLSAATYVRFESFKNPSVAPGQNNTLYPWPYIEGLTIDEAAHELNFMVMGAYGKLLPKQFGAPIRLHTPWKYGFKHNKSVTRITLTDKRPVSFWEELQGNEYGFWANVNPDVPHRRWSQATERVLGTDERVPTQLYNGYGEQVAALYADKTGLGDALFF